MKVPLTGCCGGMPAIDPDDGSPVCYECGGPVCGWCGTMATVGACADTCPCPDCEVSRALDDDADMSREADR